ncbi:uncharacterized protein TNCV_1396821 [Trichonephila clavipes]|nr:uncharacterized protein TNCV_1396821 [Trichonephila clavipes]
MANVGAYEISVRRRCENTGNKNNAPEINRRSILAMRCIGQGLESFTFLCCNESSNPVEQKSHDVINNKLSRVIVAEESMKMAAVEEYSSSPDNLLTVSGDGTWKTRGHSSLIGVCTVIGAETENRMLGHVQKRMGTRLMKLKLVYSKKELSDGKTIGGKGSVKEMQKAIWAVWGHSCSTDDEPIHWFCPTNPNTWCKYNAAINNNLQNYKHKPSVAKAVQDVIKPVFADLSHPALLKKCLGDRARASQKYKSRLSLERGYGPHTGTPMSGAERRRRFRERRKADAATQSRRIDTMASEVLQNYRSTFIGVKCIIIDEVSMIGCDVLHKINLRLQEITGVHDQPFGNLNVIFCGDLHQLPPVNASPVYKGPRNSICGPVL